MTFWHKIDVLYRAYLDYMDNGMYLVHDIERDTIEYRGSLFECRRYLYNKPDSKGVVKRSADVETYLYGTTKSEYERIQSVYADMLKEGSKVKKKR